MRLSKWSLFVALAGAAAFALPVVNAFARGGGGGGGGGSSAGGGGSGGGSGGGGSGGGAPKTGGGSGGSMSGKGASKSARSNTGSAKGRGDYLELMQQDEAEEVRPAFLGDASNEVVRTLRADARSR